MSQSIFVVVAHPFPVVREGLLSLLSSEAEFTTVEARTYDEITNLSQKHQSPLLIIGPNVFPEPSSTFTSSLQQISTATTNVLVLAASCDEVCIQTLVQAGIKGFILMDESRNQLLKALRTVAKGQTWFSQQVTEKLIQETKRTVILTPRQLEVLGIVAEGKTNEEIAQELGITERTVRSHLEKVFARLKVHNRAEAVTKAFSLGLLDIPPKT